MSQQRIVTSLRVGERVLAWCDDGLLLAEYALFDQSEMVLHATDPVTVREAGYMTTAGQALDRLADYSITPELAEDAGKALPREVLLSYARGAAARSLFNQLGAHVVFDGAVYRAAVGLYEGMWLDLRALASDLQAPAALLIQVLHLAAALAELPESTAVHLLTAA